jgi:GT2 family glycosyltransferase
VVRAPGASSVAALNNLAVQQTDSSWLLFLDAGVEPVQDDWLTIMAEHVQRPEVGAVGARLVNSKGTIEHAGIVLGVNGIAQPAFGGFPAEDPGVNRQLQMVRNYSAVSGGCLLVRREVFQEVDGFDSMLPQAFADIDICLKIGRAGYLIVYTPLAKLYRHASVRDKFDPSDEAIMRERWPDVLASDPFYNPNLSRERADFSLGE